MQKHSKLLVSLVSTVLLTGCAGVGGLPFVDLSNSYSEADRNNPEVWIDSQTGLMWSKCPIGLKVNKRSRSDSVEALCVDESKSSFTWDQANELIKKTNLAGYSDWRMPTIYEYRTLERLSISRRLSPTNVASSCPNELYLWVGKNYGHMIYWSSTKGTDELFGKNPYKGYAFAAMDNKNMSCRIIGRNEEYRERSYTSPKEEFNPATLVRGPNIGQK